MKLFKKAREMFDRMVGRGETPARTDRQHIEDLRDAPPETVPMDPRYAYRRAQRDFERRARHVQWVWQSGSAALGGQGTCNLGRNAAKRGGRAVMIARGASPRVAKRKQRDWIEFALEAA